MARPGPADSAGRVRHGPGFRRLTIAALAGAWLVGSACASTGATTGPAAFPLASGHTVRSTPAGETGGLTEAVMETALSLLGSPYRLGGDTPAGFDCSGFVRYALARHRVDVPRTVSEQYAAGRPIAIDEVQAGDLLFFSTIGPGATHVGIVLDPASDQTFIHAPSEGGAVRAERFDTAYWQSRFVGARRVF